MVTVSLHLLAESSITATELVVGWMMRWFLTTLFQIAIANERTLAIHIVIAWASHNAYFFPTLWIRIVTIFQRKCNKTSDTFNGSSAVHIHPPSPTANFGVISWACCIALWILLSQRMFRRSIISTKTLWTKLDSGEWVTLVFAVLLATTFGKSSNSFCKRVDILVFQYLPLWCVAWSLMR